MLNASYFSNTIVCSFIFFSKVDRLKSQKMLSFSFYSLLKMRFKYLLLKILNNTATETENIYLIDKRKQSMNVFIYMFQCI